MTLSRVPGTRPGLVGPENVSLSNNSPHTGTYFWNGIAPCTLGKNMVPFLIAINY